MGGPRRPMNVLVTGGTGSIGVHLLRMLGPEYGRKVAFSHAPPEPWQCLKDVEYLEGDLLNTQKVLDLVREVKPSWVFHLGSQSNVGVSLKRPVDTLSINLLGTQNLLDAVRRIVPQSKVLLLSSSDVYGRGNGQLDLMQSEETPMRPLTPFATSKAAMELLAYQFQQSWGTHIVMARPFNYTGPFQADHFVLPSVASQLVRILDYGGEPVIHTGNLDVSRDFVDVRDLARALILIMSQSSSGEVFNICSGRIRTVRELVETMLDVVGVDVILRRDPSRERDFEQPLLMGSVDKLMAQTGWKPLIAIEDTVEDVFREMRQRRRQFSKS
jgi:GDP-4-dehydro-6-deoxy-D-mannose reductase